MTTLKLDLDTARLAREPFERMDFLMRLLRLHPIVTCIRRTRHGWHVMLTVRETLEPLEVVAIQAIAGSDWRRESFNTMRVRAWPKLSRFWRARWNTLYEPF